MGRTRAKRKPKADGESSTDNADNEEEPEDMEGEDLSDAGGSSAEEPKPKKAKPNTTNAADVHTVEDRVEQEALPPNDAPDTEATTTKDVAHSEEHEPSQVQDTTPDEAAEVKEGTPPDDHTEGTSRDNVEDVVEEHDVNGNVDGVAEDTPSKPNDEVVLHKAEDDLPEDQVAIVGNLEVVEKESDVDAGNPRDELLQDSAIKEQDHPKDAPADNKVKDSDVDTKEGGPHAESNDAVVKTEVVDAQKPVSEVGGAADSKKVLPVYGGGPSSVVVSEPIHVNGVPFYKVVNRRSSRAKNLPLERDPSLPVIDKPKLSATPPPSLPCVKQELDVQRHDDTVDSKGEGLKDEGVEGQDGDVEMQGEDESGDMADEAPLLLRAYTPQSEQAYNAVDNEDEMPPLELSYEGPTGTGDLTYEDIVEPGDLSYEGPVELQNSTPVNDEPVPNAMDVSEHTLTLDEVDTPQMRLELEDAIRSLCSEGNQNAFNFTDIIAYGKAPEPANAEETKYYHCFSAKVVPDPQQFPLKGESIKMPKIGNEVYPYLGNPKLGVYLSRHPDAVLPTGFLLGATYRLYVYNIRVDKFETIEVLPTTDNSVMPSDPTCKIRLSVESKPESDKPFERFLQSLVYISELNDLYLPVEQPEVIRLQGVVDFTVNEDCTVLYTGDVNFTPVGRLRVNVANIFKMGVNYMDLGGRPLMDFALSFNAEVSSLIRLTSKSVFKRAMTRVGGNFEDSSHIHIRHDNGGIADYIIKHTCFLSADKKFSELVKFLNDTRAGAYNVNYSGFMPELKNNDQCCVNYVFPNCNAVGILGIPSLPYEVLHVLQMYRLPVGPQLCPLRTIKHEKRLFALATSNLLARSDRISDNDIRVAAAAAFQRFGNAQEGFERFCDTEADYSNIEAEEDFDDDVEETPQLAWDLPAHFVQQAFLKGKASGKSLLLNHAFANVTPRPPAIKRNSLVLNMARRVARRGGDGADVALPPPVLDMQVRRNRRLDRVRDHDEKPTTSVIQEGFLEINPANPLVERRITTAVIFEPVIFFNSQIPVEMLHDVLSITLTPEASHVMGDFSIILHQHLYQAFENAKICSTDSNANMILYASSFSNYTGSDKLVVQERHYCDDHPLNFRTFLICAQATRRKRKLESLIVLSENASTVDHAIYERNKVKILTPTQYMAAMYSGDNTILMP